MNEGDPIPSAQVIDAGGQPLDLATLAGPVLIYFYPKDDTSGCTREALDFTANAADFAAAGVRVIGISPDSPASHAKFAAKHALAIELASDPDTVAAQAFGVWGEKKLYGRSYMGVERATFLFAADGRVARAWRKVRVPGHVDAVLAAVRAL